MIVRVLATVIVTGGAAIMLVIMAPLLGAGLAVGLSIAVVVLAACGGAALLLLAWGRVTNDRWRLALEAETRQMEAQIAARRWAELEPPGQTIQAYYRRG